MKHYIPQLIKEKLNNLSARWHYFIMLTFLIVVAAVALVISDSILLEALTKENLQKMQISLERNGDELANTIYATNMIPGAIESTPYYGYIKTDNSGYLPDKYAAVLAYIGKSFRNQMYLTQGSACSVLLLEGVNSICTSSQNHITAEDCFLKSIIFQDLTGDEVIDLLHSEKQASLLPAQNISLYGHVPEKYLTYIVCPPNSSVSVMTMYREDYIMKRLGIDILPTGTEITITDSNGVLIDRFSEKEADKSSQYYILTSYLKKLNASVVLKIPKAYFVYLLKPAIIGGIIIIAITLLSGVLLSLFLSKKSVQPLHDILSKHQTNGIISNHTNEYLVLDNLIVKSKQDKQAVEKLLAENLLAATISMPLLSEENVQLVLAQIPQMRRAFRIAIFHVKKNATNFLQPYLMEDYFDRRLFVVQLDRYESGFVVPNEKEVLNLFVNQLHEISEHLQMAGFSASCGISAPIDNVLNLQDAARQARLALPINGGIEFYCAGKEQSDGWAMKEIDHLYQYLLADRREDAHACLKNIISRVDAFNAEMVFNGLLLVLESVRSEYALEKEETISFKKTLIPMENMAVIRQYAERLIAKMEKREQNEQATADKKIIEYLNLNFADANLCVASVAEQMRLPEKDVQKIVKNLTGLSFSAYLLKLRMERAQKLLCETQLGVKEIGEQCGYCVESTFYRTFRRYFNATPIEYRSEKTGK